MFLRVPLVDRGPTYLAHVVLPTFSILSFLFFGLSPME